MSTRMPHRVRVTTRTHEVFAIAHDLANHLGSPEVTPLHVLHAMLREGRNPAIGALHNLRVRLDTLARNVEAELPAPPAEPAAARPIVRTASDEQILDRADIEARELGHPHRGSEHLLLAFLRDEASVPARVLARHRVRFADVRTEILRLSGACPNTDTSTI